MFPVNRTNRVECSTFAGDSENIGCRRSRLTVPLRRSGFADRQSYTRIEALSSERAEADADNLRNRWFASVSQFGLLVVSDGLTEVRAAPN